MVSHTIRLAQEVDYDVFHNDCVCKMIVYKLNDYIISRRLKNSVVIHPNIEKYGERVGIQNVSNARPTLLLGIVFQAKFLCYHDISSISEFCKCTGS